MAVFAKPPEPPALTPGRSAWKIIGQFWSNSRSLPRTPLFVNHDCENHGRCCGQRYFSRCRSRHGSYGHPKAHVARSEEACRNYVASLSGHGIFSKNSSIVTLGGCERDEEAIHPVAYPALATVSDQGCCVACINVPTPSEWNSGG